MASNRLTPVTNSPFDRGKDYGAILDNIRCNNKSDANDKLHYMEKIYYEICFGKRCCKDEIRYDDKRDASNGTCWMDKIYTEVNKDETIEVCKALNVSSKDNKRIFIFAQSVICVIQQAKFNPGLKLYGHKKKFDQGFDHWIKTPKRQTLRGQKPHVKAFAGNVKNKKNMRTNRNHKKTRICFVETETGNTLTNNVTHILIPTLLLNFQVVFMIQYYVFNPLPFYVLSLKTKYFTKLSTLNCFKNSIGQAFINQPTSALNN